MRLIFSRPPPCKNAPSLGNTYPESRSWEDAIVGYLKYKGIFLGENEYDNKRWELSYNYVYNFFDFSIFEAIGLGKGKPSAPIELMREFLKSSGLTWSERGTAQWLGNVQNNGVRFWIEEEKL